MDPQLILKRRQHVLYDKKWKKFLKRTWLFRYIPFVDFALAAGSMAMGNVHPESDFDVIIGARSGRIFTARFFSVLFFGFLGWRRRKLHNLSTHKLINSQTADKVCLNHFITPAAYRLSPPHDKYWQTLYLNLVPIFGSVPKIREFWELNRDWIGKNKFYGDDLRHLYKNPSWVKKSAEKIFGGAVGDWLEKIFKAIQVKKIEQSLKENKAGYKPRIKYTDKELEFHPDTYRTQFYSIESFSDKL